LAKPRSKTAPFPSKQELLDFIRESPVPVGKREIARAFHIRGQDRAALKAVLKELQEEGHLDRQDKRRLTRAGGLPEVLVVEIAGLDPDGELLARPAVWRREGAPPKIYMAPERRGRPALGTGERVLVRLRRIEGEAYEGRTIRALGGYSASTSGASGAAACVPRTAAPRATSWSAARTQPARCPANWCSPR
jgi:ribonuclease R